MKIYILKTSNGRKSKIRLYNDRENAFYDMRELCEYAGVETDEADPGFDLVVDLNGDASIELSTCETEDQKG